MLRKKLVAFLGTFAFLAMMPMAASAATIDFNATGDIGPLVGSDILVLDMRLNLGVGENPNVFSWSMKCAGCVVTGYSDYISQPGYFPTSVDWTGNATNDFADSLFGNDFLGPPASPQSTPGTTVGPVGTLKVSGFFNGQGSTITVGYVTVHVTSNTGSLSVYINPASDGFFCAGGGACTFAVNTGSVTWVPEPGTAMLLALGLSGLGVMGRRGRK
jgi:hypothetical protein